MVLPAEIVDEPYASENTRKIAILHQILTSLSEDMIQITPDSQTLMSASLMAKEAINTVLKHKLEQSPALAAKLSDDTGLEFEHRNLGKGRAYLTIEGDIAKVSIKLGKDWFNRPPKL